MAEHSVFNAVSPLEFRYADKDVGERLSEEAFVRAKLRVELALVEVLHRRGVPGCDEAVVAEVRAACAEIKAADVYAEEEVTRHDIRALVNCIQRRVSDRARPFVHMTATSYDVVETARAMMFTQAMTEVLLPALKRVLQELVKITVREADQVQVGRTHGQHAVPITFGFAMASFLSRLGQSYERLNVLTGELHGKFSGAVGAFNASTLFFDDPLRFEREVLAVLGVTPGEHSTQIAQPEPLMRLLLECGVAAGIMGNVARDLRNLQRTEIGEVGEEFGTKQVGSSTMPQKRNPIVAENIESMSRLVQSRMGLLFADQISEHQRDLTGSASSRTYGEIMAYAIYMAKRLAGLLAKLRVDAANMQRNLEMQQGMILAEPLYLVLAGLGHPDAHERVRELTLKAQAEKRPLQDLLPEAEDLTAYLARMTEPQREILRDPLKYTGIAAERARTVAETWLHRLA